MPPKLASLRDMIIEGIEEHTQIIASATSVTLNLLSTSQSTEATVAVPFIIAAVHPPVPLTPSCSGFHKRGSILNSSVRKVNAHLRPHHAAGAMLSARQTSRGRYQRRSTPSITATRGCKGLVVTVCGDGVRGEALEETLDGEGGGRKLGSRRLLKSAEVLRRRVSEEAPWREEEEEDVASGVEEASLESSSLACCLQSGFWLLTGSVLYLFDRTGGEFGIQVPERPGL
ncbi:hypothetical protein CISG_08655 [Coccidioides immitis RMSCC 3703]|uniref:Uncharacterized protein n=1 Tax=Coccidioides immitis RMSCC 3703 TaxID=454286 RepID=A0A0J8R748_COCIT|nr:hypothetical protein CISG_08655 [Coccidioides immitis RMSCC 3703]